MPDPIRVLLVDDHALFRSGIKSLLQRHAQYQLLGHAGHPMDGLKRAGQLKPDVVLLDLHMPGLSGRDAAAMMAEESPSSNVLMLTVSEDAEDLIETLRAGACGYLLKNIEADALIAAINKAAEGESVISPQMMGKLLKGVRGELPPKTAAQTVVASELNKLSPREREILTFLARGQSNKEIARKLELAESTVKIHVQNILRKLNLTSRVQAAVFAVEQGIVQDSDA